MKGALPCLADGSFPLFHPCKRKGEEFFCTLATAEHFGGFSGAGPEGKCSRVHKSCHAIQKLRMMCVSRMSHEPNERCGTTHQRHSSRAPGLAAAGSRHLHEKQFHRLLNVYVMYFNGARPHQDMWQQIPEPLYRLFIHMTRVTSSSLIPLDRVLGKVESCPSGRRRLTQL
jgi:hypothetical protein